LHNFPRETENNFATKSVAESLADNNVPDFTSG
jgi:hypothetical protein